MAWLPKSLSDKALGEGKDDINTLTSESPVLFLYPVSLADGKVGAASIVIPYGIIKGSIIENMSITVSIQELRDFALVPSAIAEEMKKPSSAMKFITFVSTLDIANSAKFISLFTDETSVEVQAYTRIWLLHATSSSNRTLLLSALQPLKGVALVEKEMREPERHSRKIGQWTSYYDSVLRAQQQMGESKDYHSYFRSFLVEQSGFPVYSPIPDIGETRKVNINGVLTLLFPEDRNSVYATIVGAPSYAYLSHYAGDFAINIPDYDQRVNTLASALTVLRDEERRVILPRIEELEPREEEEEKEESPISSLDQPPSTMPPPAEEITTDKPYIFPLRELEPWRIATIRSHDEAKIELGHFTRGALDGIDLRGAVVTGSTIPAVIFRPYGHRRSLTRTKVKHHFTHNVVPPEEKGNDIRELNRWFMSLNYPAYVTKDLTEKEEKEEKKRVVSPSTDIDIAVIDEKDPDATVQRIIAQLMSKYPRLQRQVKDGKKHIAYTLVDPEYKVRPIQIYPASLSQILTHHTAPVRGWYDPTADLFHISASAALSYINMSIEDYYYFAGRSPLDILYRLRGRGFNILLGGAVDAILSRIERELGPPGYPSLRLGYDAVVNEDGTLSYVDIETLPLRKSLKPFTITSYGEDGVITSTRQILTPSEGKFLPKGERAPFLGRENSIMGIVDIRRDIRRGHNFLLWKSRTSLRRDLPMGDPRLPFLPPVPRLDPLPVR